MDTIQLLLLLLVLLLVTCKGHTHGSRANQANTLMSFRRSRNRTQVNEEWISELEFSSRIKSDDNGRKMEDDLIAGGLPGQPSSKPFRFKQYAGPGCSSLGVGAMLEIGPFGVNPDGKTLYSRRFSWNKVANILFLESPAGVGFSYSNTSSDYDLSGDKRTAEDSYVFLVNWFRRFPHYKNNDFYIIGESYAGNGIMNEDTDDRGFSDYLWSHALISDETYKKLTRQCINGNTSKYCNDLEEELGEEIGNIDFYNIYGPTCMPLPDGLLARKKRRRRSGGPDPCEGEYVENYLNLPHIQNAFHANVTKLAYRWETCSKLIVKWKDSPSTMFPIYKRLIALGLRILLYSGDVDAVVPVSGTRYSIDAMNLKVIKPWRYKVVYDGLTFATVRGAGHEVPRFQPHQAFALLKMFLADRH
ncbi:Peptidase S10, serine carboxypeptidase [Cynara cardunculus var. scolymus]|uniref:Carboxypeptidase n=1 Tax=Cynara cardunculus var. scolymus TaxID=59895 RepID=A0A103XM79_CYNCS|nr:Peptidase S10, serine carboxypeptidase [Cynara cardunculus var. scolymus]